MKRGTIVLTIFPFTDLSATKRRPAVIVSKVDPVDPDVIVAFISSVLPTKASPSDFILSDSDPAFGQTGLKRTSVFKMDKLATLDKSIFSGELGNITPAIFDELKNRLRVVLDL